MAGPGQPKTGGGSRKGIPNKENADIKALVIGALHKAGGVDYLAARAKDQPVAFLGLIGKVLPLQVTGRDGGSLQVDFRWADAPVDTAADTRSVVTTIVSTATDIEPDLIEWAPADPKLAND